MTIPKKAHGSGFVVDEVPENGFLLHLISAADQPKPTDTSPLAYWLWQIILEGGPSVTLEQVLWHAHTCMEADEAITALAELDEAGCITTSWQKFGQKAGR